MSIPVEDRAVSAQRMRELDAGPFTSDSQRRLRQAMTVLVRGATEPETAPRLQLGRTVKRWSPATETRAIKPRHALVAILAALKAKARAPLASAISAAYVTGYGGDEDEAADSDRLGVLTAEAPKWAGSMIALLDTPTAPDAISLASDCADVCQSAGTAASTLDGIEDAKGTTYTIEVQDGCCNVCADDEGEHDISEPSPVPHHPSCRCVITKGDNSHDNYLQRTRHYRPHV